MSASIGHVARVAVKIVFMYGYMADIPDSRTDQVISRVLAL